MSAAALAESGLTWPAEDNGVPAHAIFALKIVHAARQAQKGPSGKNLVADDFIELRLSDGIDRNRFRRVARQDATIRGDIHKLAAPAARAGLRPQRVIIRHHEVDRQRAFQTRLRLLDDAAGLFDLRQRRHQRGAVL